MPFTTYSELQDEVVSLLHRDGDTAVEAKATDWIALAEAEMQIECKLVEFEATATITVADGSGSLPADFVGMRSIYWSGNTKRSLEYIAPARFDALRNDTGDAPSVYTISGSTIRLNEGASGDAVATYNARFTALSDAAPANSLLTNYPFAYLYGALKHASIWTKDDADVQKYGLLFNASMGRITKNNTERKHAGPLQVRPR